MYIYMLCVQLLFHVCHAMCLEIRNQFLGAGSCLAEAGLLSLQLCGMLTSGCLAIFRAGLLPLPPILPLECWDRTCMLPDPGWFVRLPACFFGRFQAPNSGPQPLQQAAGIFTYRVIILALRLFL